MALFSRSKKETAQSTSAAQSLPLDRNLLGVLLKPRITEKAVGKGEKNVYTFVVARHATKYDVADAVRALYNVTPVKVNIVNKSPRQTMSRSKGRIVTLPGLKKAYVYLKAGDSITLV